MLIVFVYIMGWALCEDWKYVEVLKAYNDGYICISMLGLTRFSLNNFLLNRKLHIADSRI
jgi:hypothetical protein